MVWNQIRKPRVHILLDSSYAPPKLWIPTFPHAKRFLHEISPCQKIFYPPFLMSKSRENLVIKGMFKFDLNVLPYWIRFDFIYKPCRPLPFIPFLLCNKRRILWCRKSDRELIYHRKFLVRPSHIIWALELWERGWHHKEESKHCWTLHLNSLHAK